MDYGPSLHPTYHSPAPRPFLAALVLALLSTERTLRVPPGRVVDSSSVDTLPPPLSPSHRLGIPTGRLYPPLYHRPTSPPSSSQLVFGLRPAAQVGVWAHERHSRQQRRNTMASEPHIRRMSLIHLPIRPMRRQRTAIRIDGYCTHGHYV